MTAGNVSLRARAQGAFVGLAVGDAAGFPSLFHRTARMGWRRSVLWRFAKRLDDQHVLRFPLPFTLGPPDELLISGTDDSEFAAVAAMILLETEGDFSTEALFAGWQKHVVQAGDDIWSGIAERASIVNARHGLRPPETGGDNPAHYDDGAACRAVAVGVRFAGRPEQAADVARNLAQITHAEDGVWAAEAMAATISAAVGGSALPEAVEAGRRRSRPTAGSHASWPGPCAWPTRPYPPSASQRS
jgi:ADP-ribosylglycohydrolase